MFINVFFDQLRGFRQRRVNVNAVHAHPEGVVQMFASSSAAAMTLLEELFVGRSGSCSARFHTARLCNHQRCLGWRIVGANALLLGTTSGLAPQWQFYAFTNSLPSTNDVGFTNGPYVAFATFLPPQLGQPRASDADVDLYVSCRSRAVFN